MPRDATEANIAPLRFAGTGEDDAYRAAFPKAQVVTISECASHPAVADLDEDKAQGPAVR